MTQRMHDVIEYARKNGEGFLHALSEWLRIPSISTDPDYSSNVLEAAQWLAQHLRQIGTKTVEVVPTAGHPIVYAEHMVDVAQPTVLVYGHYDVQPPDPLDEWESPPFEPVISNGYIYGRGTSDDKGQLFVHVAALESYLRAGRQPPVNLKFVIEGEEESGSLNLETFLAQHTDRLKADVGMITDTAMLGANAPTITYGLRGMAYVEVILRGPKRDLHSGVYGGAVENPISVLARLISGLHDADHRITLSGFYDSVRALDESELARIRELPFDEESWLAEVGVARTRTERGFSAHLATTVRPALDVNGIWGGYQKEGAKTVLPARAGAKISVRLVPDQESGQVVEMLRRYFEHNLPDTMQLTFRDLHGGQPFLVDVDHPAMQAARQAMEAVFGSKVYFAREGGSIPVVADLKQLLGISTVLMGFGLNSDAIHSPNEHFGLDRFRKGIECSIRFMEAYSRTGA